MSANNENETCSIIFYKFETTGFKWDENDHIIGIGSSHAIWDGTNYSLSDNKYLSYVNPKRKIGQWTINNLGHTNEHLESQKPFAEVCDDWFKWIKSVTTDTKKTIFVGYYCNSFDFKFLMSDMKQSNMLHKEYFDSINLVGSIDLCTYISNNQIYQLCGKRYGNLKLNTIYNALCPEGKLHEYEASSGCVKTEELLNALILSEYDPMNDRNLVSIQTSIQLFN
jgi:DNA polymerase III alpha subunit (gram-positive type)